MSSPSTHLSKLEASEGPVDEVSPRRSVHRVTGSTSLATPPTYPEPAVIDGGPCMEPSDESLMQGIAAREYRALDHRHARYWTLLSKIVSPILSNQADAEETLQDVFTEIWTRR